MIGSVAAATGAVATLLAVSSSGPFLPPIHGKALRVTEATVCAKGYSASVRPSPYYTNDLKAKQMDKWNLPGKLSDYEEDHFISLALGGNPTSPQNLWPQPWSQARADDVKEAKWYRDVCWYHKISLRQAQQEERAWKLTHG